ncbi:hypothetical protein [Saccharibacillus deserti]|uniref:hypothetical protein n=1 Tax=Saccharibacillus deserti TaxID=1634444 RepID=UPI00155279B6|nr:hypothetical protein [Saccharibacillus deserti]
MVRPGESRIRLESVPGNKQERAEIYENECRVVDRNRYGDHYWIVGEIVQVYQDGALFDADGLPDPAQLSIPLYMGRSAYRILDDTADKKIHRL